MTRGGPAKILYLNRTAAIGGAEQSLLVLLRGLDRTRFEPRVLLPSQGPLYDRIGALGVEVEVMPMAKLDRRRPYSYCKTVLAIRRRLVENGVALLHSNTYLCNQYGLPACRLAGIPSISHVRLILGRRAVRNTLLRRADRLLAISTAVRDELLSHGAFVDRVELIYNGVDVEAFSPTHVTSRDIRREVGCLEGDLLVGVLGRITESKGLDVLVEAMRRLADRVPRIIALVVGGTEIDRSEGYLRRLTERVRELNLQDRVRFMPFVDDVRDVYQALDLVVVPSLAEPFGRVLIEGMAMGKAVVATRAGGPLEIIEDGVSGLLVEPGDPGTLSEAIENLVGDPQRRGRMGILGRQRVKALFSDRRYVDAVERTYTDVLRQAGVPRGVA